MSYAAYQHDFQQSEDDDPGADNRIKRGTRACDRCRRIKSKCELTEGEKCKNCVLAGTSCTYQGPSFKRGPPKGYIHAIEQRWQQVECILGTIMASPRAESVIDELRGDPHARAILDRVNSGPYGSTGRRRPTPESNNEDIYATIMNTSENAAQREERRSRRQSRVTRENVSTEDASLLMTPTREWQDQLSQRIGVPASQSITRLPSPSSPATSTGAYSDSRSSRRRRLETPCLPDEQPVQRSAGVQGVNASDDAYANWDEVDDTIGSFGHLSLDESKEIHYHGHASGLPLLAKSDMGETQTSGAHGIWDFTDMKYEAASPQLDYWDHEDGAGVELPPIDVQNHLLDLYFTYVHPFFPIVHKQHFMSEYNAIINMSPRPDFRPVASVDRQPVQRLSKLLLLTMYGIASRYSTTPLHGITTNSPRGTWDIGLTYAEGARRILSNVYPYSHPSTCQALLLLGIREFGLGSMQRGWIYTGIALRMAIDLGLNRNADHWTQGERELFSPIEKQTRKQIWWCICTIDKLSSIWLGRPITFRSKDYSTLRPDIEVQEEYELWRPVPAASLGADFSPAQAHILSCFREACALSAIMTEIMDALYPVRLTEQKTRRALLEPLEARLHKWLFGLPEHLRYSPASMSNLPLPHILVLHIEYCAAVLLLHRAFIPRWNSREGKEENFGNDPLPLKSFDLCQSAASHISTIVTLYHQKFGLNRCPPFLSIYLQSAGIMHIITLVRRPSQTQASQGLMQCIAALKHMEQLWPGATRVRSLLEGAKVELDQTSKDPSRPKRNLEDAFGTDPAPTIDTGTYYSPVNDMSQAGPSTGPGTMGVSEGPANMGMLAHSLGIDLPGLEASTSFYPGYQWWPRQNMDPSALPDAYSQPHQQFDPLAGLYTMSGVSSGETSNIPSRSSTSDASFSAPDYLHGARYPILDRSPMFPANLDFHDPRNPGNPRPPGL